MCEKDQICNSGGGWTRLRTSAATSRRTRLRPRRELFPARPTPALPIACATKKTKTKTITKVKIKTKTKTKIKTNTKKIYRQGKNTMKMKGAQSRTKTKWIYSYPAILLSCKYFSHTDNRIWVTSGLTKRHNIWLENRRNGSYSPRNDPNLQMLSPRNLYTQSCGRGQIWKNKNCDTICPFPVISVFYLLLVFRSISHALFVEYFLVLFSTFVALFYSSSEAFPTLCRLRRLFLLLFRTRPFCDKKD